MNGRLPHRFVFVLQGRDNGGSRIPGVNPCQRPDGGDPRRRVGHEGQGGCQGRDGGATTVAQFVDRTAAHEDSLIGKALHEFSWSRPGPWHLKPAGIGHRQRVHASDAIDASQDVGFIELGGGATQFVPAPRVDDD